ncbi:DEAD/DEAH box helicase [Clostridiisalibacter paucivorans]|uniref:DEAD/DEAH box helicase n=1 Tax=Clostridiisalibacter paucivorans TaxID=408753 RepID=UPI00047C7F83|nr:DEAD/DEAH box helicase [Clostridiisalibacter paucivorans]
MKTVKFQELEIMNELKKAIEDMGFEEMTPIQAKAIPEVLTGRDIIGQAQTGTGKTASFAIPIINKVDVSNRNLQALILCPTRELAIQVSEEVRKLCKYTHGIKTLPIYGGQPIDRQIKALKKGVQVVIGTPGRVMDHMRRKTLKFKNVNMVVLDEADEMLNMGFREDIETILQDIPEERQTLLFSATMPKAILEIAKTYQKKPKTVKVVHKQLTVPNIEQYYLDVKKKNKFEVLTRLIDVYNPKLALIFSNTKKKVDELVGDLQGRGYLADGLHGDMKQRQRDRVMNNFRINNVDILVATDVAARGIDVDDVEMVINFDVPQDDEYYVHRIGRTGRAGRTGLAFTLVSGREIYKLKDIQRYTKTKIRRHDTPSANDVEEAKSLILIKQIKDIIEKENLTKQVHIIDKLIEDDHTSIDVAAALLKMLMGKEEKENSNDELDLEGTGAEPGMVRLFINIGRKQKISPKDVVGSIAGETKIPGEVIGAIDIYDKYTFVEVPKEHGKKVLKIMNGNTIKGRTISMEVANRR